MGDPVTCKFDLVLDPNQESAHSLLREPDPTPEHVSTVYRWPLSRALVAEVRFVGSGPVKAKHLDLLCDYLDVAKGALSDEALD